MRRPTKDTWMRFVAMLAAFWVLPLISVAINRWIDPYAKWMIVFLMLAFPLITLITSLVDSQQHGFGWWWVVAPPLCFLTTLFVYYDIFDWFYGACYAICGLVGTSIGTLTRLHMMRRKIMS